MRALHGISITALLALTACQSSVISTQNIPSSPAYEYSPQEGERVGYYALPMRALQVTAMRYRHKPSGTIVGYGFRTFVPEDVMKLRDPDHIYGIAYNPDALSLDVLSLGIDADGSLSSLKSTTTDQTPEIVGTIAKTVIAAYSGVPSTFTVTPAGKRSFRYKPEEIVPEVAEPLIFDPTDPADIARVNAVFARYSLRIRSVQSNGKPLVERDMPTEPTRRGIEEPRPNNRPGAMYQGLRYRVPLTYRVTLESGSDGVWTTTQSIVVKAENASPVLTLDVDRSLFVARQTDYSFQNGELVTTTINKQSEVMGPVNTAAGIVNDIISIPARQINYAINGEADRNELLKLELERLKTLAEIEKLKKDGPKGPAPTDPPPAPSPPAPSAPTPPTQDPDGD